jgi:DNA-directed RNA polymerase specialized sigma24 family protein
VTCSLIVVASRPPSFDTGLAETLAQKAAGGDEAAFQELVALVWPDLGRTMQSSRRLAAAGATDDGPHDVSLRIMEKLRHDDFRALRLYVDWHARHPEKSFLDWLRIVAANATRDYLRELRGQSKNDGVPTPKQLLNVFSAVTAAEDLGTRPPMTWAQTARQLLEFAESRLPESQRTALADWLTGADFDEIAKSRGLGGADEARKSVRAAIAILRREFAGA